jgi:glycosyltransferase involved in cell wall biosynthesis
MKTVMHYWAPGPDGSIEQKIQNWRDSKYRGELLYGLTHLKNEGFDVIFPHLTKCRINGRKSRLSNLIDILKEKRKYDIIYAPYSNGLQALIYLRGLRLFRKKIVVWQHTPIEKPKGKNFFRRLLYRIFLNGIDKFIFFGEIAREESLQSGIIHEKKTAVLNWGADLDFFSKISNDASNFKSDEIRFISTGMYYRDFEILIKAFEGLSANLDLYIIDKSIYEKYLNTSQNIKIHLIAPDELSSYKAGLEAAKSSVILICTLPVSTRKYSFGLTSLIEATALGKPVIITRNKYIPQSFEANKVGLFVEAGNVAQLREAIIKISSDRELLQQLANNSKRFAVERCNLETFTKELASLFQEI